MLCGTVARGRNPGLDYPKSNHPFQGREFIMIPNPGWQLRRNPYRYSEHD